MSAKRDTKKIKAAITDYLKQMKQLSVEQKAELDALLHDVEQRKIEDVHKLIDQIG